MRMSNNHERVTHAMGNHKSLIEATPVMGPIIDTTERKGRGLTGTYVSEKECSPPNHLSRHYKSSTGSL